ncbi:protein no-on-transient A-like [Drosophila tropicalis]|uniref:protein no-on-transient A-like n=1 Tax=Drosophila tropicalis TaxID=46794 RepID=UPI0035AB8CCE
MSDYLEQDDSIDLTDEGVAQEEGHSNKEGGGGEKMNSDDFRGETPRNRKRYYGGADGGGGGAGDAGGKQYRMNGYPHTLDNNAGNFGHENPQASVYSGHHNNGHFWTSQNFVQKLRQLSEPTLELEPIETQEVKFSGRSRLYIGNMGPNTRESDMRELFKPFGEIDDIFSNSKKNFTFLRLDFYDNAVKAKRALDGSMYNGRQLRVSFAPKATSVRVSNLNAFVTNELLYKSFEIFGSIERATVKVDDRGKSLGEGFVDFARNSSANMCLRMCQEKCFFLTASLQPCVVEPLEFIDNIGGLSEKSLNKKMPDYIAERSVGPRFAEVNSFEHDYGGRYKILHSEFKMKQEELKRKLRKEEDKLRAQLEYIRNERETDRLREELRQRELMQERQRLYWEMHKKRAEDEVPPNGLRRQRRGHFYQPDDIDYSNEPDGGRFRFDRGFRGENKEPLLDLNKNAAYGHEIQNRIVRQGNEMQRYRQEGDHYGDIVFNSTPFDVFGNQEDDSAPQNDRDEPSNTLDTSF